MSGRYAIQIISNDRPRGFVIQDDARGLALAKTTDNAVRFATYDQACDFIDDNPSLLSTRHTVKVVRATDG